MRERLRNLRDRLGFAELATVGVLVLAFVVGGLIGGTPRSILQVCSGFRQDECGTDDWVELNPAAGLLGAVVAVIALLVIDLVVRRRRT